MIKTFEDFLNENQNIDENIDFEQLNESFTNQELKDAIKAHGGLRKFNYFQDARMNNSKFDLKNAKYAGYLNSETYTYIVQSGCSIILFKSQDLLLYTNDGGIIVVNYGDEYLEKDHTEWIKKMKFRNNNWIEDEVSEHPESDHWNVNKQYIRRDGVDPDRDVTFMRRRKHTKNGNKK